MIDSKTFSGGVDFQNPFLNIVTKRERSHCKFTLYQHLKFNYSIYIHQINQQSSTKNREIINILHISFSFQPLSWDKVQASMN
jgi:hypothetical protein